MVSAVQLDGKQIKTPGKNEERCNKSVEEVEYTVIYILGKAACRRQEPTSTQGSTTYFRISFFSALNAVFPMR